MLLRMSLTSYDHDVLLQRARTHPRLRDATASAFASWVFKLSHPDWDDESEQAVKVRYLARFCEKDIKDFCLWFSKATNQDIGKSWRLEFADPLDGTAQPFIASALTIDGNPLRCIPDVVLRNTQTNDIIIIERKVTLADLDNIPDDGWPNLRAQLWCYRWIDAWLRAPKLTLVGDIWQVSRDAETTSLTNFYRHWDRNDRKLQKQSLELFEKAGGHFLPIP